MALDFWGGEPAAVVGHRTGSAIIDDILLGLQLLLLIIYSVFKLVNLHL